MRPRPPRTQYALAGVLLAACAEPVPDDWPDPGETAAWTEVSVRGAPPPPALDLQVTGLRTGELARWTAHGAHNGARVYFLRSTRGVGAGPCFAQIGGQCTSIVAPVELHGSAIADATGVAELTMAVPTGLSGRHAAFQAAIVSGLRGIDSVLSDAVRRTVDDPDFDDDGYVEPADCDDTDAAIHPGADERCHDGVDNDCDGRTDLGAVDAALWFVDHDGDGHGAAGVVVASCEPVPGFADNDDDCDDDDALTFPGAPEQCDGQVNACGGVLDDLELDRDADGLRGCDGDCDDDDATRAPGHTERCNGVDDDCDGVVPAAELDLDGDGSSICGGDCDDTDPAAVPGAAEVCDAVGDEDCDGRSDCADDDCALSLTCCAMDDREPDDTVGDAAVVPVGGTVSGTMCDAVDVDHLRVTSVPYQTAVRFTVCADAGVISATWMHGDGGSFDVAEVAPGGCESVQGSTSTYDPDALLRLEGGPGARYTVQVQAPVERFGCLSPLI